MDNQTNISLSSEDMAGHTELPEEKKRKKISFKKFEKKSGIKRQKQT